MKYTVCFTKVTENNETEVIPIKECDTEEQAIELIFSITKQVKSLKNSNKPKCTGYYSIVNTKLTKKEKSKIKEV